jgi:hypothetical protein
MERAHNLFLEMKECGVATNTQCFNPLIIGFATQVNLSFVLLNLLKPCTKV